MTAVAKPASPEEGQATEGVAGSHTFEGDGLFIEFTSSEEGASILWRGVSDSRDPGKILAPVMQDLVVRSRGRKLTVDFSALDFMNSATVAPVLQFIRELEKQGTHTVLVYDVGKEWQRINVQCMRLLVKPMAHVDIETRNA